ncbi:MAG: hypothetical protein QM528_05895 [Phycisphaerales bacterium]|nr:hypothetical protein [Phycisphaerales bacterium]
MAYLAHLKKDKKLNTILLKSPITPFYDLEKQPIYLSLIRGIISQQLNTKVATTIYNRFLEFYRYAPSLVAVQETSVSDLRRLGLSNSKCTYLHAVASFFIEHKITDKQLYKLTDEEIIDQLTQIKGVGKWTVEMVLIFSMNRADVFPVDDLGVQKAMISLYQMNYIESKSLIKKQLQAIAEKWRPYRSYATKHLWAWVNGQTATH